MSLAPNSANACGSEGPPQPAAQAGDVSGKGNARGSKRTAAEQALADGANEPLRVPGGREPTESDRTKVAFVTWSRPKIVGGYWLTPDRHTHAEFAAHIGAAWDSLESGQAGTANASGGAGADQEGSSGQEGEYAVAVFKESHKDGAVHYHAALILPSRTRLMHRLKDALRARRVACHVSVPAGRAEPSLKAMLRYVAVPTPSKLDVDPSPYTTRSWASAAPCWEGICDEVHKAWARLRARPAGEEELKNFLFSRPDLTDWDSMATWVDTQLSQTPEDAKLCRLSHFLSKSGGSRGKDTVAAILDRRDNVQHAEENKKTFAQFLEEALRTECTCAADLGLAKALAHTIQFHDGMENAETRGKFAQFAERLVADEFPDREQTLCLVGAPGSGKSSAVNPFLNVVPERRVYRPCYENKFPYGQMRPHHLLIAYQDFRCTDQWQPSTVLLMLERAPNVMLDKKCEKAIKLANPPRGVMTCNYLEPAGRWKPMDIQALWDRMVKVEWKLPIPVAARAQSSMNVLESKCKKCSGYLLCWLSPVLATRFGVNPQAVEPTGRMF